MFQKSSCDDSGGDAAWKASANDNLAGAFKSKRLAPFNDVSYFLNVSNATGVSTSDLGIVPSAVDRQRAQARALQDEQLRAVREQFMSLDDLIVVPTELTALSENVQRLSIFPKVFDLHVPPAVLHFLFNVIGEEYSSNCAEADAFNVDEHVRYCSSEQHSGKSNPIDSNSDQKNMIKQVSES